MDFGLITAGALWHAITRRSRLAMFVIIVVFSRFFAAYGAFPSMGIFTAFGAFHNNYETNLLSRPFYKSIAE